MVTDGRTDGRTTDRRTDTPSCRDARTHLKMTSVKLAAPELTLVATEVTRAVSHAVTDSSPAATDSTSAATDVTPAVPDSTPAATDSTPAATDSTPAATDATPAATDTTSDAAAVTGVNSAEEVVIDNNPSVNRGTYSSAAGNLGTSQANWTLAKARNKRRIVPVIGRAERIGDDDLEGVAPIVKNWVEISVSRLSVSTTSDKVKSHLHKHGIEVRDVFILSSKISGTKSAKVRVAIEHKERVKSPDIWPQHCRIADWINFKKKAKPVNNNGVDNGSL